MKLQKSTIRWSLAALAFASWMVPTHVLSAPPLDPLPEPTEIVVAAVNVKKEIPDEPPRDPQEGKPPVPRNKPMDTSAVRLPPSKPVDRSPNLKNPPVPAPGDAPVPGAPPEPYRSKRGVPVPPMTAPDPTAVQ